jgi:hypothetical protein
MAQFAIIKRGVVLGTWDVKCAFDLHIKFDSICKEHFQKAVWADHGRVLKRKIDPSYVVFRSERRRSSDLVLVNVNEAPSDYLDALKTIYKW